MQRLTPGSMQVTWMDALPDDRAHVELKRPLLVVTENSGWLLTRSHYLRTPRPHTSDRPTSNTPAIAGRLDDARWHALSAAAWDPQRGWTRISIKPVAGPPDGVGIVTGAIVQAGYVDLDDTTDPIRGCGLRRARPANRFARKYFATT